MPARGMDGLAAKTLDYNKQLLALGINVNLAPVCDVSTDAGDFIYARSFGGDAAATSEFVTAAVGAIRDAGVAAVLKHFPRLREQRRHAHGRRHRQAAV